jgi:hypothetical protein
MRSTCFILAAFAALHAAPASAESTWSTLQRFGWTGKWAPSCASPPGGQNVWITLTEDAGGSVKRKVDGGMFALMGDVDRAQILTPATLRAVLRNDDPKWGPGNGLTFDTIQTIDNNRVRTTESTGSDGKVYIKDGILQANQQPSAWISKCGD